MVSRFIRPIKLAVSIGAAIAYFVGHQQAVAGSLVFYGECISDNVEDCTFLEPTGSNQSYLVDKEPIVEPHHFADAEWAEDSQLGEIVVTITLAMDGARRFGEATTDRVGKSFYIIDEGRLISAPIVREPILGGRGQISGGYTEQTARDLVFRIFENMQQQSD